MCTSFSFQPESSGDFILARTMDFVIVLEPDIVGIPRNFQWQGNSHSTPFTTKHALIGVAQFSGNYVFADGLNEHGLMCCALYFPQYATYAKQPVGGNINLAPHEVVHYLLSSCASLAEVKALIPKITITDTVFGLFNTILPLHWILSDTTGHTIVIEPVKDGIKVYDNPVGVMSNSPDLPWHLTNLQNYIGLKPTPNSPINLPGLTLGAFGQGNGAFGLPGDNTPPSRFVRTVYNKMTAKPTGDTQTVISTAFHTLASVDIPKGAVKTGNLKADYTQYTAVMVGNLGNYYLKTYDVSQIVVASIKDLDVFALEPVVWRIPQQETFVKISG
ncbi:MAG: choloylglycine hydrolase family protein [Culicoidibacterales bacterium]